VTIASSFSATSGYVNVSNSDRRAAVSRHQAGIGELPDGGATRMVRDIDVTLN